MGTQAGAGGALDGPVGSRREREAWAARMDRAGWPVEGAVVGEQRVVVPGQSRRLEELGPRVSRVEPYIGDPGDESDHAVRARAVQVHVQVIMQYRSRFVHGSPESADELAATTRVRMVRAALQEMLDEGTLEGFRIKDTVFGVLPEGA